MSDPLLSLIHDVLDAFENDGVILSPEATQRIMLESDEIPIQLREQRAGRVISASKLIDMEATARLFNIDFGRWENPMELLERGVREETESVLQTMLETLFVRSKRTGFPHAFTLISLVMCDILNAYKPALARSHVLVTGNYPIITQLPNGKGIITGKPDMVIAYCRNNLFLKRLQERTTAVILQTKKRPEPYDVPAQAVAYMIGMHQKRMLLSPSGAEERITYGILSDGVEWQFMKLIANTIYQSKTFSMKEDEDRPVIYRYVHEIIKDSIDQAPVANDTAA